MKTYLGVVDTNGKLLRDVTDSNGLPVSLTGRNAVDAQALWTPGMLYNGATSDMPRGNTQGTLLASAARTTQGNSPNQTNYNAKGVIATLNITVASGTGGLRLTFVGIDPISGLPYQINTTPTPIIATGIYAYELYPSATAAVPSTATSASYLVQRTAGSLPRTWACYVLPGDATSYTYSVGYSLIL